MKFFKKLFSLAVTIIIIIAIINYKKISNYIVNNYIYNKYATIEITKGEYSKEIDYGFVQITDDFIAKNYKHILNIVYTILDSGNDTFSFYCDENYKNCLNDVDNLISENGSSILSDINNYVHPYYTYKNIVITTNSLGKVTVTLEKQYIKEEIEYINSELDKITAVTEKDKNNEQDKILAFHDYIINHTKYDIERADNMNSPIFKDSQTHTAYGLLHEKKSLCGGYSDILSIYLHRLNIPNYRISDNNHVWNLVKMDTWKHLDATWDDPVTNTGEDILLHDYFLISTKELKNNDNIEHQFNENVYLEAK